MILCDGLSSGAPGEIRTHDLQIRSLTLYPSELRAHAVPRSGLSRNWGGRWGSNPRPQEPQSCALPSELRPPHRRHRSGPPEWTRTTDLRIRSPLLCPAELQAGGSPLWGELVGARGFEPPTPCAQGRCATRLRYTPTPRPLRRVKDRPFRTKGEYMFRAAGVSTCSPPPRPTSRERKVRSPRVNRPPRPLSSRRSQRRSRKPTRHGVVRGTEPEGDVSRRSCKRSRIRIHPHTRPAGRASLDPDRLAVVVPDRLIPGEQRQPAGARLSDDHPVEGIPGPALLERLVDNLAEG